MERKWWQEATVYQIYPKSFYDSNGDGIGDINGIIKKLPYIKNLGCDTIWLCPIYASPMKDNGYDVSDYYKIDPIFGTNEDLYRLIKEASESDVKIIMDLVVNHCSSEHKWFKEFLKNPCGKYRDYFIVKEGKTPPNNWRSVFGGSVWEKVENRDLYYYHTFLKEQPDLNWECKELREEIYSMVNWWLEKGIAGFRVDAITHIKKELTFPDAPVDNKDMLANANPYSQNYKGIDKFLNELKRRCFEKYDCMTVAEAPGVFGDDLASYIGKDGYFSMIFDFSYADIDVASHGNWYQKNEFSLKDFRDIVFKTALKIQEFGWGANYLENHDQPRSLNKYLPENSINYYSATMLGGFYFFLRGTPFIYQGQEIGTLNSKWDSIEGFDDLQTKDQYKRAMLSGLSEAESMKIVSRRSRDNSRNPFSWDDSENAGFSKKTPWLKLSEDYKKINVKNEEKNEKSVLNFYKAMINVRKENKEDLIFGDFIPCFEEYDEIAAYKRGKILLICNMSDKNQNFKIDFKKVILNNYDVYDENILKPWQIVLLLT